jgi:tetratricopeptide (TPR) repeat protein
MDKPNTLCLNMIVKNERKIITRMLESVLPIIDYYCICDTGSTDDTIELIETFFRKHSIPGKIVKEPFKNFEYNRNYSLQCCNNLTDYVLLMDADMVLKVGTFDKGMLSTADSFHILQGTDDFYYQNTRIVKNNGLYNYKGVTHEYINTPPNNINKSILKNQLFIQDYGDGGSKSDKFLRDIKLLTNGIIDEPNNERYHFYLANTYHDSGDYKNAIEIYKKRIKFGGWNQEVWYSYYRIGLCYKQMQNIPEYINALLDAYNYLPDRLEALHDLISHYRHLGQNKVSKLFYDSAKQILNKNNNIDDYLFLSNDVYKYKLYYEYTIIAGYNNIKNINDEVITILNNTSDSHIYNNLFSNMKFYKDVLIPSKLIDLNFSVGVHVCDKIIKFTSSSSSIIKHSVNDQYLMNIRAVNYRIDDRGCYHDCDVHIISVNKMVVLSKDFEILNEKLFYLDFCDRRYIGVEDMKIFNDVTTNELTYIGTGYHANNQIGIVTGKYDLLKDNLSPVVEITSSFNNNSCEKNWVFVDYLNSTHIIYKWFPLQICKLDNVTNSISVVETKQNMPRIFSHTRGSTCGFKYNNELWFVVHLVSYEEPRHYYHLLAVFNENMDLMRYSAPFKFEGEPIEYSLGLVVEDSRVLITYSVWDRTTKLAVYDKLYVDNLLKYTN